MTFESLIETIFVGLDIFAEQYNRLFSGVTQLIIGL